MSTTVFEAGLAEVQRRLEQIERELDELDVALERLQADAAEAAWQARERAEAAIGDVRSRRIELGERAGRLRISANGASAAPPPPSNGKDKQ